MQAKHAGLFGKGPLRVVGNVVPLPKRIQFADVEVVVVDKRRLRILSVAYVWFDPSIGRLAKISRKSDERETVVPSYRHQGNHAARAAVVRHDDAPPFA